MRVDKWLWTARFFRTRTRATAAVNAGRLRVNGVRVAKASAAVRPGDTLTFPQGRDIRVIRVLDFAARRGSAVAAGDLYEDLAPPTSRGEH